MKRTITIVVETVLNEADLKMETEIALVKAGFPADVRSVLVT